MRDSVGTVDYPNQRPKMSRDRSRGVPPVECGQRRHAGELHRRTAHRGALAYRRLTRQCGGACHTAAGIDPPLAVTASRPPAIRRFERQTRVGALVRATLPGWAADASWDAVD